MCARNSSKVWLALAVGLVWLAEVMASASMIPMYSPIRLAITSIETFGSLIIDEQPQEWLVKRGSQQILSIKKEAVWLEKGVTGSFYDLGRAAFKVFELSSDNPKVVICHSAASHRRDEVCAETISITPPVLLLRVRVPQAEQLVQERHLSDADTRVSILRFRLMGKIDGEALILNGTLFYDNTLASRKAYIKNLGGSSSELREILFALSFFVGLIVIIIGLLKNWSPKLLIGVPAFCYIASLDFSAGSPIYGSIVLIACVILAGIDFYRFRRTGVLKRINFLAVLVCLIYMFWFALMLRLSQNRIQQDGQHLVNAIESFRRDVGRYPDEFAEMIPDYMESMPRLKCPPFTVSLDWNYRVLRETGNGKAEYFLDGACGYQAIEYDPINRQWKGYSVDAGK